MVRAVQIFAALLLIAVLTVAHAAAFALFKSLSLEFGWGVITGSVATIIVGLFLHWLDSPASGRRSRSKQ